MRFLHIADLHIGKQLNKYDLLEDQAYVLAQIHELARARKADAVLIAGDVYDKSLPAADAVSVLDEFLTALIHDDIPVLLISGNHDSPERLDFASRLLAKRGLYIAGLFGTGARCVTLADAAGPVDFWLLPFVRPAMVRPAFPEAQITSYEDAVQTVVSQMPLASGRRSVLVAHQFVTAAGQTVWRTDSETIAIGGQDHVDFSIFAPFHYVALGHLHRQQAVGRETVRYAGSPLKYSISEAWQQKTVTEVVLAEDGTVTTTLLPLTPLRELREIKGKLSELTDPATVAGAGAGNFIHAILTDEEDLADPRGQLLSVYPYLLDLELVNRRSYGGGTFAAAEQSSLDPLTLFCEFYRLQQNEEPSEAKLALIRQLLEEVRA